jgi:hypothetical protein
MRQRVMIAMAMLLEPQVMIMDGPTTAVDVVVQRDILREIVRPKEELNFALHDEPSGRDNHGHGEHEPRRQPLHSRSVHTATISRGRATFMMSR